MTSTRNLGRFTATAYGPPWEGIQGTGVTATGIDLRPHKQAYIVAVDPSVIPLHSRLTVIPNPFGDIVTFRAEDTGGAIRGRRIDIYDWRGRREQLSFGRRQVTVTILDDVFDAPAAGADPNFAPTLPARPNDDGSPHAVGESEIDYSPIIRATARRAHGSATYVRRYASLIRGITSPVIPIPNAPEVSEVGSDHPTGLRTYRGIRMCAWIADICSWADRNGYRGGYTSGYRTNAEQAAACEKICGNPDGCPGRCAKPGTSNHHGTRWPGGAVDVTDPAAFARTLARYPGGPPLRNALPKDPVHFSLHGN